VQVQSIYTFTHIYLFGGAMDDSASYLNKGDELYQKALAKKEQRALEVQKILQEREKAALAECREKPTISKKGSNHRADRTIAEYNRLWVSTTIKVGLSARQCFSFAVL
jgi:hypothetical protein